MKNLYRVTAFPKTEFGGNKAGVYVYADDLSEKEMQVFAKEVGYSETAFVMNSDIADFKVRFFTPLSEVNLCGHATIATFNLLRDLDVIATGTYTQETKAGVLELVVKKDAVYMQQVLPEFFDILEEKDIHYCFKNKHYIDEFLPIQIVSTGMKEIFLPVKDVETLHALEPSIEDIIEASVKYNVIGIHAFSVSDEVDAYGRNFAPFVGIEEESATGTSNGALGCYLFEHVTKKHKYTLRQGYSMKMPSEIITKLDSNENTITKVWVGGTAKVIEK